MLLLNHGAIADVRDNEGLTPMEMAEQGDYPERDEVIEAIMRLATTSGNGAVHPEGDDTDDEEKGTERMSLPSLPHNPRKESPVAPSMMSGSRFLDSRHFRTKGFRFTMHAEIRHRPLPFASSSRLTQMQYPFPIPMVCSPSTILPNGDLPAQELWICSCSTMARLRMYGITRV